MGKNIGRNDPCPCGSGKKYKKCCIDKKDQSFFSNSSDFLQLFKNLRKGSKIKHCLYPDKSSCSEKIIRAHSIQNNKILNKISTKGVVYMPCPKPDNPFAAMTQYGRKEATVFTGFCGYHDNNLFQPIENNNFNKSKEHIFLYTYRCFANEYHKKLEVIKMEKLILENKPSQLNIPKEDSPFKGVHMGISDLNYVKDQFDNALLNNNYDILTSVVWEFDCNVNFAATGFEALKADLEGNKLQDLLNKEILAKHIFVTVFPEEGQTYFIISWLKENDPLFTDFYKQLKRLSETQRKNYINNLLPLISENIAINPEAWESWEEYKKNEFNSLILGLDIILEESGGFINRLEAPSYNLFEL